MPRFVDHKQRIWIVEINTTTLTRVKSVIDVDLLDLVNGDLAYRIANDPVLLCNTLYVVCQHQAQSDGVSDEEFGEGMVGDVIDEACGALLQAMQDYLPERDRHRLIKSVANQKAMQERAYQEIDAKLNDPSLPDKMAEVIRSKLNRIDEFFDTSTSLPDSSESTPDH